MRRLFHISDDKNIEKFIPRESKAIWNYQKYVWSISEDKIQNYLLPRDCPRICLKMNKLLTIGYCIEELELKQYENIIFAPESWEKKIENSILYRYEFSSKYFKVIDKIAEYYVSEKVEIPIEVRIINNCFEALGKTKTKLILLEGNSMNKVKENVINNTNEFSIIRWSNMQK